MITMPHQVFLTKNDYEKAYNALIDVNPTAAYSIIPVYPPDEIERIYTEDINGFHFAFQVLLDSGEDKEDLKEESELAIKQIEERRKHAYRLWDEHGR
jgi:hypothetical protein